MVLEYQKHCAASYFSFFRFIFMARLALTVIWLTKKNQVAFVREMVFKSETASVNVTQLSRSCVDNSATNNKQLRFS